MTKIPHFLLFVSENMAKLLCSMLKIYPSSFIIVINFPNANIAMMMKLIIDCATIGLDTPFVTSTIFYLCTGVCQSPPNVHHDICFTGGKPHDILHHLMKGDLSIEIANTHLVRI